MDFVLSCLFFNICIDVPVSQSSIHLSYCEPRWCLDSARKPMGSFSMVLGCVSNSSSSLFSPMSFVAIPSHGLVDSDSRLEEENRQLVIPGSLYMCTDPFGLCVTWSLDYQYLQSTRRVNRPISLLGDEKNFEK